MAPTDLPLPLAVAGIPPFLELYNRLHGFYCNISLHSTENFPAVLQNELGGKRQPLWLFDD